MSIILSPIKFLIYFSVSFLILSIPVNSDKHVFDYLEKVARPITSKVFFFINQKTKEGIKESKKLFTNSEPIIKDKIKSTFSSAVKKTNHLNKKSSDEHYTEEEKEAIKKILSNEY